MQQLDVPVIQKAYDLYKALYGFQKDIPKIHRHTLWQKCNSTALDIIDGLLQIGHIPLDQRSELPIRFSAQVDMLRVFLRLSHDVRAIDQKKYIILQAATDEIGRMLGGWLKSLRQK